MYIGPWQEFKLAKVIAHHATLLDQASVAATGSTFSTRSRRTSSFGSSHFSRTTVEASPCAAAQNGDALEEYYKYWERTMRHMEQEKFEANAEANFHLGDRRNSSTTRTTLGGGGFPSGVSGGARSSAISSSTITSGLHRNSTSSLRGGVESEKKKRLQRIQSMKRLYGLHHSPKKTSPRESEQASPKSKPRVSLTTGFTATEVAFLNGSVHHDNHFGGSTASTNNTVRRELLTTLSDWPNNRPLPAAQTFTEGVPMPAVENKLMEAGHQVHQMQKKLLDAQDSEQILERNKSSSTSASSREKNMPDGGASLVQQSRHQHAQEMKAHVPPTREPPGQMIDAEKLPPQKDDESAREAPAPDDVAPLSSTRPRPTEVKTSITTASKVEDANQPAQVDKTPASTGAQQSKSSSSSSEEEGVLVASGESRRQVKKQGQWTGQQQPRDQPRVKAEKQKLPLPLPPYDYALTEATLAAREQDKQIYMQKTSCSFQPDPSKREIIYSNSTRTDHNKAGGSSMNQTHRSSATDKRDEATQSKSSTTRGMFYAEPSETQYFDPTKGQRVLLKTHVGRNKGLRIDTHQPLKQKEYNKAPGEEQEADLFKKFEAIGLRNVIQSHSPLHRLRESLSIDEEAQAALHQMLSPQQNRAMEDMEEALERAAAVMSQPPSPSKCKNIDKELEDIFHGDRTGGVISRRAPDQEHTRETSRNHQYQLQQEEISKEDSHFFDESPRQLRSPNRIDPMRVSVGSSFRSSQEDDLIAWSKNLNLDDLDPSLF
ncbi:unnamed protein product [Amoebophrya sp. A25]|nr:unnamed protein product [Amoebophrya sp. A25]|eukprot:GSA25T00021291001.1